MPFLGNVVAAAWVIAIIAITAYCGAAILLGWLGWPWDVVFWFKRLGVIALYLIPLAAVLYAMKVTK